MPASSLNLFITGTDTGIGKTWAALGCMAHWQSQGLAVNGMKPVASGAAGPPGQRRNADAVLLREQSSRPPAYERVNPYAFAEPIAPHIAAARENTRVELPVLAAAFAALAATADRVVVEGVGGWRVPLCEGLQTADLVRRLGLVVVLVVGLRLGCINHALLTAEAIQVAGAPFGGWLASALDPEYGEERATLDYLGRQIPAPFLGNIPCLERLDPGAAGAALELQRLRLPS